MQLQKRIKAFENLNKRLNLKDDAIQHTIQSAVLHNGWFTSANVENALSAIKNQYLNSDKLNTFCKHYQLNETKVQAETIGLVMAGNLPLVGFQDLLYILLSGNKAQIKMSAKDEFLSKFIINTLIEVAPEMANYITIQDQLKHFDAIIATGSNNTSRYFEHYFGKYPNIIRKNRNSIAILNGNESDEQLLRFSKDVFSYFGLGCRNVSKILVPPSYDFKKLLAAFENAEPELKHHHKYKNNYDYQLSLLLINGTPHFASENLLISENNLIASPIACLHYEYYDRDEALKKYIIENRNSIQCIVADKVDEFDYVNFGESQSPGLFDYADDVDVMDFLLRGLN